MIKSVIKFYESVNDSSDKRYETTDGEVVSCDERIIDVLWHEWVVVAKQMCYEKDGYTIFEFSKPIDIKV